MCDEGETEPARLQEEILHRRGALRSARARYPGMRLTAIEHGEIDILMARIEQKSPLLAAVAQ